MIAFQRCTVCMWGQITNWVQWVQRGLLRDCNAKIIPLSISLGVCGGVLTIVYVVYMTSSSGMWCWAYVNTIGFWVMLSCGTLLPTSLSPTFFMWEVRDNKLTQWGLLEREIIIHDWADNEALTELNKNILIQCNRRSTSVSFKSGCRGISSAF